MSINEVPQKLTCRSCGAPRVVTMVSKPEKDRVVLYMLCPRHQSEVVYNMTIPLFEQAAGIIRDHVFLCRKCGQPTEIIGQRIEDRLMTLQVRCPIHGLGDRNVNVSLFDILMGTPPPGPPPGAPQYSPPQETPLAGRKFCTSCGAPVASPEAAFCHKCGSSLQ